VASRGDDKAMAGLLRRSLASNSGANEAGAEGTCPGPDILAAYYERSLDRAEISRYELHFSQCARCRQQLATMARAEEKPGPKPARQWLWDWRWLGSAATVLLFVAVWAARRSAPVVTTAKAPVDAVLQADQEPVPDAGEASPRSRTPPSSSTAPPRARPDSAMVPSAPSSDSRALGNQRQPAPDLPLNGREYSGLSTLVPGPRPPLPEPSGTTEGLVAGKSERRSTAAATEASKTRNMESPTATSYGAANRASVAETAVEPSIQILIRTPNPKVLWRIAGGGLIERSENEGATWHGQLPDANAHLVAGAAPRVKVCWVVGRDGLILLTKDATKWEKIPPPIPADFIAVTAKDASSATVTTSDGLKFMTVDGGKKWKPAQ
jgi:hypothetical protein